MRETEMYVLKNANPMYFLTEAFSSYSKHPVSYRRYDCVNEIQERVITFAAKIRQ